jgi:DNA-binding response OmpR family regulator
VLAQNVRNENGEKPPNLLMYGRDRTILELRRIVLSRAGYDVTFVTNTLDLSEALEWGDSPFDLLVLCQTVPCGERDSLDTLAASAKIPVYRIKASEDPQDLVVSVSRTLSASRLT